MMNNKIFRTIAMFGGVLSFLQPVQAVNFSVFGDVSWQTTDTTSVNNDFALGGLDLFAAEKINENTSALVELVIENTGQNFKSDLERFWIRHAFSDQFKLSAGRFHSPLGYWNRNLHHGSILQDTVGRPFFIDFEDSGTGILPVHSIGVMANGYIFSDNEDFKYEVIISNGPSLDTSGGFNPVKAPQLDPNNVSDTNSNKSIAARITYHQEDSDWTLGFSTMQSDLGEASNTGVVALGKNIVKQQIYSVDFRWENEKFDILSEFFSLQNKDEVFGTGNHNSTAYYIQGGYHISSNTKLIYRYSDLSFDANDSYYLLLGTQDQSHNVFTLRYDIDGFNTLKFEFDQLNSEDVILKDSNTFRVQWSFLIP